MTTERHPNSTSVLSRGLEQETQDWLTLSISGDGDELLDSFFQGGGSFEENPTDSLNELYQDFPDFNEEYTSLLQVNVADVLSESCSLAAHVYSASNGANHGVSQVSTDLARKSSPLTQVDTGLNATAEDFQSCEFTSSFNAPSEYSDAGTSDYHFHDSFSRLESVPEDHVASFPASTCEDQSSCGIRFSWESPAFLSTAATSFDWEAVPARAPRMEGGCSPLAHIGGNGALDTMSASPSAPAPIYTPSFDMRDIVVSQFVDDSQQRAQSWPTPRTLQIPDHGPARPIRMTQKSSPAPGIGAFSVPLAGDFQPDLNAAQGISISQPTRRSGGTIPMRRRQRQSSLSLHNHHPSSLPNSTSNSLTNTPAETRLSQSSLAHPPPSPSLNIIHYNPLPGTTTLTPSSSFPTTSGIHPKGRNGPLKLEQRREAAEMRKIGACTNCRQRKAKCDSGTPCQSCLKRLGFAVLGVRPCVHVRSSASARESPVLVGVDGGVEGRVEEMSI